MLSCAFFKVVSTFINCGAESPINESTTEVMPWHGGNVIAIHWQFRGNVPQRAMHNIVRRGGFGLRLIDLLTHLINVVEIAEIGYATQQLQSLLLMSLNLLGFGIRFQSAESTHA